MQYLSSYYSKQSLSFVGFEPTTDGLEIHHSIQIELERHKRILCLEVESNHRQVDFQSTALPTELSKRKPSRHN